MREKQKERRSERERETEGDGARFARVCARQCWLRRVTGEYSFIKLDEEGASEGQACAAPLSRRIGACAALVGESSVFRLPLTFPSVPSSVSLVLIVSSRSPSRSLVRACVRASVRPSVRPTSSLSSLSLSLSVAPLIPPGVSSVRMIPAARSLASRYIYPLL